MEKRININQVEPQAFKAMYALEGYLAKIDISKTLKELIKSVPRKSIIAPIVSICIPKMP